MRKARLWKTLVRRFLNLFKAAFESSPDDASGRASGGHRDGGLKIEFADSELERQYAVGRRDRNVDKYYQLLNQIEESIKAGRFDEAKKAASASMALLPAVVNWARSTSATGAFDLKRIPAIDRAGKIAVAQSDLRTLQVMQEAVNQHNDLKQWQQTLQAMIGDVEVVESILTTVRETPGYLQKDLKNCIVPHVARLDDLCHWMAKVGRIRRERSGKSYKLSEGSTSLPQGQRVAPIELESNIERLGKIVSALAPQLNELCPALQFPTSERAIALNIQRQLREHRRVTLRNGAYRRHGLPVGVCFGFFGDVGEPQPPFKIQIPRERVSGRGEFLEQLQSLGIPRGWEQCNREPTDWTVIEATAPHDVRTDDEIANWVKARFNDLADHRLLMWIDANDHSPKADE